MTDYSLLQQQLDPNVEGKVSRDQFLRVIRHYFSHLNQLITEDSTMGCEQTHPRTGMSDRSKLPKNSEITEPEVVSEAELVAEHHENNHVAYPPAPRLPLDHEDPIPLASSPDHTERDWFSDYCKLLSQADEGDTIVRGIEMASFLAAFRLTAEQAVEEIVCGLALRTDCRRYQSLALDDDQFLATNYNKRYDFIRQRMMKFCIRGLVVYLTPDRDAWIIFGHQIRAAKAILSAIDGVQAMPLQVPLQCTVDYLGYRGFVITPLETSSTRVLSTNLLPSCDMITQRSIHTALSAVFVRLGIYASSEDPGYEQQVDRLPAFVGSATGVTTTGSGTWLQNLFDIFPVDTVDADVSNPRLLRPEYVSLASGAFPLHARAFSDPVGSGLTISHHTIFQQAAVEAGENLRRVVIPAFVKSTEERWSQVFDSSTLTTALHQEGINARYLGLCYENALSQHTKRLFLSEMVARTCKRELQVTLQCEICGFDGEGPTSPTEIGAAFQTCEAGEGDDMETANDCKLARDAVRRAVSRIIIEFLNLTFGRGSADSKIFWDERIVPQFLQQFTFSSDTAKLEVAQSMRDTLWMPQVFHAFLYHTNVEISSFECDLTSGRPFDEPSTASVRVHSSLLCETTTSCVVVMERVSDLTDSGDHMNALELLKARISIEETISGERCSPALAHMLISAVELSLSLTNLESANTFASLAVEASPVRSAVLARALITQLRVMNAMACPPIEELIAIFTDAIKIASWQLTSSHPFLYGFYVTMMEIAKDRQDQELTFQLFNDAATLMKNCFGRNSIVYADVRLDQGAALLISNHSDQASCVLDEALAVLEQYTGENDSTDLQTVEIKLKHARCFQLIAQTQAAQPCVNGNELAFGNALRAYNVRSSLLPTGHPATTSSLLQLGELSAALGDSYRALEYYRQALAHLKACSEQQSADQVRKVSQTVIDLHVRSLPADKLAIINKIKSRFVEAMSSFEAALACEHEEDGTPTDSQELIRFVSRELLGRDPVEYVDELIAKADRELQSFRHECFARETYSRASAEDPVGSTRGPASSEAAPRFASFAIGQRSPPCFPTSSSSFDPHSLITPTGEFTCGSRLAALLFLSLQRKEIPKEKCCARVMKDNRPPAADDAKAVRALAGESSDAPPSPDGTPQSRPRDVVFIHSDAYYRALSRLPVHPRREQMTLALLVALSAESNGTDEDPEGAPNRAPPFGMQFIAPSLATEDQLTRFHARDYVDALRRTANGEVTTLSNSSRKSETSHGRPVSAKDCEDFELVDDAHVFPGLYEYCRFVAGASLTAADALRHLIHKWRQDQDDDPTKNALAPVAINLGGGRHHAMRGQASGFCYVNDVVLAIQRLLSPASTSVLRVQHVLCVDIDVHHGDGVQEAFLFSRNVTTISFHLLERAFFPGTGTQDEIGVGRGKHHNVNVPLGRGIVDSQFHAIFSAVLRKAVECIDPDVIVLVGGVDTLARDPLGGFNLTCSGISECIRTLIGFNYPMLLLGGGGYSGADACRAFARILTTVAAPNLYIKQRLVPEHIFYEEYGPDFRLATKAVIHRSNTNTDESLGAVRKEAIAILEKAKSARIAREAKRTLSKRKRA